MGVRGKGEFQVSLGLHVRLCLKAKELDVSYT